MSEPWIFLPFLLDPIGIFDYHLGILAQLQIPRLRRSRLPHLNGSPVTGHRVWVERTKGSFPKKERFFGPVAGIVMISYILRVISDNVLKMEI